MHEWYKTFIVLAECRSFTDTAKRLFCSQPTVSQHIQQLEKSFECSLIVRNKRQIELTAQGELLLTHALMVQKREQELRKSLTQVGHSAKIPVYLSHYISTNFFDELFDNDVVFSETSPYELNSYNYSDLKKSLLEKRTKFAVMPIYEADRSLTEQFNVELLFEEELVLIMAKHHPLASRQQLYARDLKDYPVYLPQSDYYAQSVKQALLEKEVAPNFVQMPNFTVIKQVLQRGIGVAFIPKKVIHEEADLLVDKRVKGLTIRRYNGLVISKEQELTAAEQSFCHHIKRKLGVPV